MANDWTLLNATQDIYLAAALGLLKSTLDEYDPLKVNLLKPKMQQPTVTASKLLGLYVYSYADTSDPVHLSTPLASAFFFLRQVHRPKGSKNEDPAYCLSVGADGTLDVNELKQALSNVCNMMRRNTAVGGDKANLEIMHTKPRPLFHRPGTNLETAYNDFIKATSPPMLESKGAKGTIDVIYPWTDPSTTTILTWWNIKEK